MARPRRKPPGTERRRLNLNFDMGVKSEAAAYTYLKKLSANRQATRYVTSLVIDDLAGELHDRNTQKPKSSVQPVIIEATDEQAFRSEQGRIPEQSVTPPQPNMVVNETAENPQKQEDDDPQISQEGLLAALDIFGSAPLLCWNTSAGRREG